MSRVAEIIDREGVLHGALLVVGRAGRRVARTANAATLGWRGGRLPLGSTVIGARAISVGEGFDAAQPVWLEAVSSYAGASYEPSIIIGARLSTSGRLHISAVDLVEIGNDCLFGTNVYIGDHAHGALSGERAASPSTPPRERSLASRGPVRVGDRVWLGDNVVVTDGVMIGDGCVVGANSVVTRDLPAGTVAVGSPAKPVKRFDEDAGAWLPAGRTNSDG